jgi:hypothetical protein
MGSDAKSVTSEQRAGLSRRGLLRTVTVGGLTIVAGGAMTFGRAAPALAAQGGWRWCFKCEGLWFRDSGDRSCPYDLLVSGSWGPHAEESHFPGHGVSGNYTVKFSSDNSGGQDHWRYCWQCSGMFFVGPDGNRRGRCAGGTDARHDPSQSGAYRIDWRPIPGGQGDWRWCKQCEGLWFTGNTDSDSYCPATVGSIGPHVNDSSAEYFLHVTDR